MQQRISVFWRKWLGIPRILTSVALFQRTGALQLPFCSLVEEYKCAKVRLVLMMKDSSDAAIARVQPDVRTGRRWDVETAAEAAISDAKFKEIQGITRGIGKE